MPYAELPPLSDDLELNCFDTLTMSSKRTQTLGPLWFTPPRYKPTRSNTRLDVISIRQSRYRAHRPRGVPDEGDNSGEDSDNTAMDITPDVYVGPRYILSPHTAAMPYTPRAFFPPLYAQQQQVHSMGPALSSSNSRLASHRILSPYAYEQPKCSQYKY